MKLSILSQFELSVDHSTVIPSVALSWDESKITATVENWETSSLVPVKLPPIPRRAVVELSVEIVFSWRTGSGVAEDTSIAEPSAPNWTLTR
ncbi:MAG TPA: hypothetical protein ENH65_10945 [Candidatus Aminicenantes bacterium]|nr:hypothetical protein [Candidatus Aminicenantes bacterium]